MSNSSPPRYALAASAPRSRPPPSFHLKQRNQNTAVRGGENVDNNANASTNNRNNNNLEAAFSKQLETLSGVVASLQQEADSAALEAAEMRELTAAKIKEVSFSSALNSEIRAKFVRVAKEAANDAEALAAANKAAASVGEKIDSCARKVAQAEAAALEAEGRALAAEKNVFRARGEEEALRGEVTAMRRELQVARATAAEAIELRCAAERRLAEEQKKFTAAMSSFGAFGGFGRG